jgi:hypothetical protein
MPTKRLRLVRRRVVDELPPECWRFLCDLAEPGDEGSDALIAFEFLHLPMDVETAWSRYGVAAIDAHQAVYGPDSLPALWHRLGAPAADGGDEAA